MVGGGNFGVLNVLFYISWCHKSIPILAATTAEAAAANLDCNTELGNCIYSNVELIKPNNQTIFTINDYKKVLPRNQVDAIQMVAFTKSTINHVPVEVFEQFPALRSLDLTYCGIQNLLPVPASVVEFANATGLNRLQLSHNNLTVLPQIRGLKNLTHFEMSYNRISHLSSDVFTFMSALKILDLSHNVIEEIANDTFQKCPALETFMMDHNRVSKVSGDWFKKKTKRILFISFTHNFIHHIHDGAFIGLDDLFHLRLSANQLTRIDLRYIDAENLDIDNNSMKSLFIHRQLKVLRVDAQSNLITKVRCDQNPKLIGLILTNNSISELGCISKMRRLEMLFLGQNLIRNLDKKSFASLINLVTLNLENNEIEYLDADLFGQQLGLRTLILSNNKLKQFNLNIFPSINSVDAIHLNGNNLTLIITDFSDRHHHRTIATTQHHEQQQQQPLYDTTAAVESLPGIENIRQTLPQLSVVDLSDNDWHCSYLAVLLRAFEKAQVKCLITTELHVNEINVKGIRCIDGGATGIAIGGNGGGDDDSIKKLTQKVEQLKVEVTNTQKNNELIMKKLADIERKMERLEQISRKEEF